MTESDVSCPMSGLRGTMAKSTFSSYTQFVDSLNRGMGWGAGRIWVGKIVDDPESVVDFIVSKYSPNTANVRVSGITRIMKESGLSRGWRCLRDAYHDRLCGDTKTSNVTELVDQLVRDIGSLSVGEDDYGLRGSIIRRLLTIRGLSQSVTNTGVVDRLGTGVQESAQDKS